MAEDVREALARVAMFEGLSDEGLLWLAARARWRSFVAGAVLLQQGESAQAVYVLQQGRVQVRRQHPDLLEPVILAELWPGDVVGEMWVLDSHVSSVSFVALEDTLTLELEREALEQFVQKYPGMSTALARVLSR